MANCGICGTENGCKCGPSFAAQIRGERERGLYGKYKVERTDGSSAQGKKHDGCPYFVLDLEHDKHAKAALRAYAESCAKDYPELAKDLRELMRREPDCGCRSIDHSCGRYFSVPRKPSFGDGY